MLTVSPHVMVRQAPSAPVRAAGVRALVTREIDFADLPGQMPEITDEPSALCIRVTYGEARRGSTS